MTTIIGIKTKDKDKVKLTLAADTKTTGGLELQNEYGDKILKLDDSLIGMSGTSVEKTLVKEIYNIRKDSKEGNSLHTMIGVMNFTTTLKDNCGMKPDKDEELNIHFIIMNKTLQVAVRSDGQIISMDDRNLLAIGSGGVLVYEIYTIGMKGKVKYKYDIQDYFDLVSVLDQYTNNKINILNI